jgi:hypothetical protein
LTRARLGRCCPVGCYEQSEDQLDGHRPSRQCRSECSALAKHRRSQWCLYKGRRRGGHFTSSARSGDAEINPRQGTGHDLKHVQLGRRQCGAQATCRDLCPNSSEHRRRMKLRRTPLTGVHNGPAWLNVAAPLVCPECQADRRIVSGVPTTRSGLRPPLCARRTLPIKVCERDRCQRA